MKDEYVPQNSENALGEKWKNDLQDEERLRIISQAIPDLIFVVDEDGRYIEVLADQKELLYKNIDDFKGRVIGEIFSEADTERFMRVIHKTIVERKPQRIEYGLNVPVGKRWFEGKTSPIDLVVNGKRTVVFVARDISERYEALTALHESELCLKEAQELAHVGHWDFDLLKNELKFSDELYRILGLPKEQKMTSHLFLETVHPLDREYVKNSYKQSLEKNAPYDVVHRVLRPDGLVRIVHEKCRNVYDEFGTAIRTIGTVQDITEQRLTEKELQKYQENLEEIVENRTKEMEKARVKLEIEIIERKQTEAELDRLLNMTAEGLAYVDMEHRIHKVNKTFLKQWQLQEEYVIGKKCWDILCEPCCNAEGKVGSCILKDGKNIEIEESEFSYTLKDGSKKVFIKTTTPMFLPNGNLIGVLKGYRDITIRKKAEEQLRKLSQVVEQSPVSVMITDRKGNIEYTNEYFHELTGYGPDEVIGKNPRVLKGGHLPRSFYKELWDTILSGRTWKGDFLNKKKDGSVLWESASIAPIMDESDKITHFAAVKQDITPRKMMEKELLEAKESAEAAARIKSSFLANMSHEIRTPMNAVLGFLGLTLEDVELSENQRKNLGKAKRAAKGLLRLINDILDVSKLESGKLELEKVPFDLRKLLDTVILLLDITTEDKDLQLILDIASEVPEYVIGDATRLKQVLMNIAGNAVKFTEVGNVTIKVKTISKKDFLYFTVSDTGIGIPKERLSTIFEAFTQVDEVRSRRYGGTGLGTTISKQIVELMGGQIWVKSEVNKGSEFHFTIPLPITTEKPVEIDIFATRKVMLKTQRSFRILLVEDIEDNIDLIKFRLEQRGHEVIVARNGSLAIEVFKKEKIDIILMDIHLPIIDGIEATTRIREIEKGTKTHTPIIAITASVMKDEMQKYWETGMDEVVPKPINFNNLFHIMEKVIPQDKGVRVSSQTMEPEAVTEMLPALAIQGVDLRSALNIWKNMERYTDALINFSKKYRTFLSPLSSALDDNNMKELHYLIHSFRGLAGNLCMTELLTSLVKLLLHSKMKILNL